MLYLSKQLGIGRFLLLPLGSQNVVDNDNMFRLWLSVCPRISNSFKIFLMFYLFISVQLVQETVDACFSALNYFKIAYFRPNVWPLALSPPQIFQIFSFLMAIQIRNAKRPCSVSGLAFL